MRYRRSILAALAATVIMAWFCASEASAWGRRAMMAPAYSYAPGWGYGGYGPMAPYNPYLGGGIPGFGMLPPSVAQWDMMYNQGSARAAYDSVPRSRNTPPSTRFMKSPEERENDLRRARFEITVPTPDAVVLFDGAKTSQTGLSRVFLTPPLADDKAYSSTIEVQWMDEAGTRVRRTKAFDFVAGETLRHRFAE